MRLPEKTIEVNFCADLERGLATRYNVFWWGITQQRERLLGWDVATRLGARSFIFQIKTRGRSIGNGYVCSAPHHQLLNLQRLARHRPGSVFYIFPDIKDGRDLYSGIDIVDHCWLVDVADLPDNIPEPLKRNGLPFNSTPTHRVDVYPDRGIAIFHSKPMKVRLFKASELIPPIDDGTRKNVGGAIRMALAGLTADHFKTLGDNPLNDYSGGSAFMCTLVQHQ